MNNKTNSPNLGAVVSVRGSVVDIRFDQYLLLLNVELLAA